MPRSPFPIAVRRTQRLGFLDREQLDRVAGLALQHVLKNRRSFEIAHQQFTYQSRTIAFSSTITANGILVLDLDLGDGKLGDRVVLMEDLRAAEARSRRHPGRDPRPRR